MISIINYGVGNLASVVNMIHKVGGRAQICHKPLDINHATKILLPGVGAFDHGMQMLHDGGWLPFLNEAVLEKKVPVLGICLGMQLMCNQSDEGCLPGLGWIKASVKRFELTHQSEYKIPHMGWNSVKIVRDNALISVENHEQRFYFTHSYHVICDEINDIIAHAKHGYDFTVAFNKENIFGVQFHPEKSHRFGMALIKQFSELPC